MPTYGGPAPGRRVSLDARTVVVDRAGLLHHLTDEAHGLWQRPMRLSLAQRLLWMGAPLGVCWPGLLHSDTTGDLAYVHTLLELEQDAAAYGLDRVAALAGEDPDELLAWCRVIRGIRNDVEARRLRAAARKDGHESE